MEHNCHYRINGVKAPCKDCEKCGCGLYRNECEKWKQYKRDCANAKRARMQDDKMDRQFGYYFNKKNGGYEYKHFN